jgi:hypothetical protein
VVFAVGLAASSLPTWLGSYGEKAVVVALANLAAAAAVNVGLFLVSTSPLTRTRQVVQAIMWLQSGSEKAGPTLGLDGEGPPAVPPGAVAGRMRWMFREQRW